MSIIFIRQGKPNSMPSPQGPKTQNRRSHRLENPTCEKKRVFFSPNPHPGIFHARSARLEPNPASGGLRPSRGSQNQDSTKFACLPLIFSICTHPVISFCKLQKKNSLWPCLMECRNGLFWRGLKFESADHSHAAVSPVDLFAADDERQQNRERSPAEHH